MRRLIPFFTVAGLALGGCATGAEHTPLATPEWRAYDVITRYDVVQRTIADLASLPHVSDPARIRLGRLDAEIRTQLAPLAAAVQSGDHQSVRRLLPEAEHLVRSQVTVLSLNSDVDKAFEAARELPDRILAEGRNPLPVEWRQILARIEATGARIAAATGSTMPDRVADRRILID